MSCPNCSDSDWVCEAHPDKPFPGTSDSADACNCGGAGMPCQCNPMSMDVEMSLVTNIAVDLGQMGNDWSAEVQYRRLPDGSIEIVNVHKWKHELELTAAVAPATGNVVQFKRKKLTGFIQDRTDAS